MGGQIYPLQWAPSLPQQCPKHRLALWKQRINPGGGAPRGGRRRRGPFILCFHGGGLCLGRCWGLIFEGELHLEQKNPLENEGGPLSHTLAYRGQQACQGWDEMG